MTTALDLAEELIVLRDLAYGVPIFTTPEFKALTGGQIAARRSEIHRILGALVVDQEQPKKVRVTAADFFGAAEEKK